MRARDQKPAVVAETAGGLLLNGSGRCLLGLRSPAKLVAPLQWDIIGGHVEPGETPEAALCRELSEELGIAEASLHRLGSFEEPLRKNAVALHHVFAVTAWSGEPSNRCDEHFEIRWFDFDDVLMLPNRTPIDFPLIFSRIRALGPEPGRFLGSRASKFGRH